MQVFSISQERNVFFSSKASIQAFKHIPQTALVETNSRRMYKGLKANKKNSQVNFSRWFALSYKLPQMLQTSKLHLTPKLKTTLCSLCSWETLASSAFAFQALQRGSRQPSSVSQPFPQKESKACHQRHKERGYSICKPQSILSLQQTLSWGRYIRYMHSSFHSKDICVFAWHWLLSLPGTRSTASDRSMSPDGREANAEREVRGMRCSKGDNCSLVKPKPFCWGRRESGPYRFWIVCFKILEIQRKGISKISFPE